MFVSQRTEIAEIFPGVESFNQYRIIDERQKELYFAKEDTGSYASRMFFRGMRPFTISVSDEETRDVITVFRPFRFYFHEVEVVDFFKESLGRLVKNFSLKKTIFRGVGPDGVEIFRLVGPKFSPTYFDLIRDDEIVGKVEKLEPRGEYEFSVPDNFIIEFPRRWTIQEKGLLFGGMFLVDMLHFEFRG